jgi:hypothetical protein
MIDSGEFSIFFCEVLDLNYGCHRYTMCVEADRMTAQRNKINSCFRRP